MAIVNWANKTVYPCAKKCVCVKSTWDLSQTTAPFVAIGVGVILSQQSLFDL